MEEEEVRVTARVLTTLNGPVIEFDGSLITLHEPHLLIDVFERFPHLLKILRTNIIYNIRDGADELMASLDGNLNFYPARLTAYIGAASQYIGFIQTVWEPYNNSNK